MRKLSVALTAAVAVALSAAPLSAQWGIFGGRSDRVPPGHMPSRGMCRVWIDGVPPGQQPRQTDCRTAERQRPYYEQRYGRHARVIYGDRYSRNDRYDTRNGDVVVGRRDGSGRVYGNNCRYVERVIAGRVIRQRVCDENGVYDRDGRIYDRSGDRTGRVYDRNGRVYDRNGNVVYRRDGRYDRDSDSDTDGRGKGKYKDKNKNKGRGRW
jgi:hypothetical protein